MKSIIKKLALGFLLGLSCPIGSMAQNQSFIVTEKDVSVCSANPPLSHTNTEISDRQSAGFFSAILDTKSWPARWQCGVWTPFHGWLYISSDLTIWFSYFMIPLILGYFLYRRKEGTPFKFIVFLFIAFILACGLTHFVDAAIFWWPAYRLSALIRLGTAVVSLGTVFALVKVAPRVLELKSPETLERLVNERTSELHQLNTRLQQEIESRQAAEEELKRLNRQLESKTLGLLRSNEELLLRENQLRESETRIKELNLELEQKVEQRTAELNTSNQELEAFSYSVSHDLRAPLRSIGGYVQILKEDYADKIDDEGNRLIAVIVKSAYRMGQLIDDLLDFSRLGKKELMLVGCNMKDIVTDLVQEMTTREENREINFKIGPLHPSKADVTMIRQVWVNLISNALKFSRPKRSTQIDIGSNVNETEAVYYIRDNGVGFNMKYAEKLFAVFQRLHKVDQFEGTGVGLALIKRIIARHGGRVWADAKVDEGATFYFSLPK